MFGRRFIDAGGLKAVIKAMQKNKEHAEVQNGGCLALHQLLYQESTPWAKRLRQ
jgi:hypothetical protein